MIHKSLPSHLPKMDVARVPIAANVIVLVGQALRNYIVERLPAGYYLERSLEDRQKEMQNRRYAFNILSVFDLEPRYDIAFMLGPNTYNIRPEVRLNSIRIPDGHFPTLIDAINEGLIQMELMKGLIGLEQAEEIAVEDEKTERLLGLLKKLGVEVEQDYVTKLMKAEP